MEQAPSEAATHAADIGVLLYPRLVSPSDKVWEKLVYLRELVIFFFRCVCVLNFFFF